MTSDCKQIVEEIQSNDGKRDQLRRITIHCKTLLGKIGGTTMFKRREANAPADEIAKQARVDCRSNFYFECILTPSSVCMKLIMNYNNLKTETQNSNGPNNKHVSLVGARLIT